MRKYVKTKKKKQWLNSVLVLSLEARPCVSRLGGVPIDESQVVENSVGPADHIIFIAPHERIFDKMLLELLLAALFERTDTVGTVMLQVRHLSR